MSDVQLIALAAALLDLCRRKGLTIATAESCTGGLVAATLTEIAGSSDVVERGFVTYSNDAKEAMLHVPTATLLRHGAVSRETAVFFHIPSLAYCAGTVISELPELTTNSVPVSEFEGLPPSAGGLKRGSSQAPVQIGGSIGSVGALKCVSL